MRRQNDIRYIPRITIPELEEISSRYVENLKCLAPSERVARASQSGAVAKTCRKPLLGKLLDAVYALQKASFSFGSPKTGYFLDYVDGAM